MDSNPNETLKNSRIHWFSGTGNSLYAAKQLSVELGGIPLTQITDAAPTAAVGGIGMKIGFVFPSYYGNLPRAVRNFVEKLDIKPDTYIFAIVTMGAVGQGSINYETKHRPDGGIATRGLKRTI